MENYVEGKVIIITGAAGGFGRLVAQKTASLGASVVASDVNEAELEATCASITAEELCSDYRAAAEASPDSSTGPGWEWMLEWMDDNGNDPVEAAARAYRFAESTCPSILEDGLLRAWFAELGIDPDLPPIAERQASVPTS